MLDEGLPVAPSLGWCEHRADTSGFVAGQTPIAAPADAAESGALSTEQPPAGWRVGCAAGRACDAVQSTYHPFVQFPWEMRGRDLRTLGNPIPVVWSRESESETPGVVTTSQESETE